MVSTLPADLKGKSSDPKIFAKLLEHSVWDTGYRIGSALQRAHEAQRESAPGGDAGKSPSPHIRRAHWHHFWVGPGKEPKERKLVLKWLPPIPVSLADDEIIPTVHPVRAGMQSRGFALISLTGCASIGLGGSQEKPDFRAASSIITLRVFVPDLTCCSM